MNRLIWLATGALAPVLLLGAPAPVQAGSLLGDADAALALRYRYEFVDQQGFEDDANASTLRVRASVQSGEAAGFSFFAEVDAITELGPDDFNSGAGSSGPDRNRFPVVADPDGVEFNQAYAQFKFSEATRLRLGRQRINLDNQRFVGAVGWRQDEQTYDALNLVSESLANTRFEYAFVANVNRIFGNDVPAGDHDSATHLLNLRRDLAGRGQLTGYYYRINNRDAPAFSTGTLGTRFAGAIEFGDRAFSYGLEAAYQEGIENNPVAYDQWYYRLDGAVEFAPLKLALGYEVLGGDADSAGASFRTPLATLHGFNGWADQFLATPDAGLEDLFVSASGKLGGWSWQAVYHDFQAEDSGTDYGDELDLSLGRAFAKRYSVLMKYADFNADAPGFADTTKAWLMLSADF